MTFTRISPCILGLGEAWTHLVDGRSNIPIMIVPSFDDELDSVLNDNESNLASRLVQDQSTDGTMSRD